MMPTLENKGTPETVYLTEIEQELMAIFVRQSILSRTKIGIILLDLVKKVLK